MEVGISLIWSARREYIRNFWNVFGRVLGIDIIFSDLPIREAYDKGKSFLNNSNTYCFFRYLDVGQHIDLIDKGVKTIILLSVRETNKKTCNSENYVAEHLSMRFPQVKFINFVLHSDDKNLRDHEIAELVSYFSDSSEKIKIIQQAWPDSYIDCNKYLTGTSLVESNKHGKLNKVNLLIVGDMYWFLNPRMENSPYVDMLSKKLNCNILTPPDIVDNSEEAYALAQKTIQENMPFKYEEFDHYWKRIHLIRAIVSGYNKIDGVLLVSDIWCEMFKEEIPLVIKLLKQLDIPFYNLLFNVNNLSTIETILETFVETLIYRRNLH